MTKYFSFCCLSLVLALLGGMLSWEELYDSIWFIKANLFIKPHKFKNRGRKNILKKNTFQ